MKRVKNCRYFRVTALAPSASAGVEKFVVPSPPAFKTTNLFEKSSPPVSKPIGGIRMSFTSEVMILPKDAPMITPTARSMALPLTANSLNSFNMSLTQSSNDDVDELFGDNNHSPNRLPGDPVLNFQVR